MKSDSDKPEQLNIKIGERVNPDGTRMIAWVASSLDSPGGLPSELWVLEMGQYFHKTMRELVETGALQDGSFFSFTPFKINPEDLEGDPDDVPDSMGENKTVSNERILDAYESEVLDKKNDALRELSGEIASYLFSQHSPDGDYDVFMVYTVPNWFQANEI